MKQRFPSWKLYERAVAKLIASQLETHLCVTPNAQIAGRIAGIKRQVDVLIEHRHEPDNSLRLIVDAKRCSRRIDVKEVEAFLGLMEDVDATHGYLVSTNGYTKAAEKRAQTAVSLRILPLDRLADFDPSTWPDCRKPGCSRGKIFWDGYPELSLAVRPATATESAATNVVRFVHYVGKCDRCGAFHVKCVACDALLHIPEDDDDDCGHRCRCNLPWFWLALIEQDEMGRRSAELHVCFQADPFVQTVDRRSL